MNRLAILFLVPALCGWTSQWDMEGAIATVWANTQRQCGFRPSIAVTTELIGKHHGTGMTAQQLAGEICRARRRK